MAEMKIYIYGVPYWVERSMGQAYNRAIQAQMSAVDTAGVRQGTTERQRNGARGAIATWNSEALEQMDRILNRFSPAGSGRQRNRNGNVNRNSNRNRNRR